MKKILKMEKEMETNPVSIQFNKKILCNIMSYLDFSTQRESAMVCKAWYEASIDPTMLHDTKYKFDASILEDEKHFNAGKHLLSELSCKSPNLDITGLDGNFNAKFFLNLHKLGMRILGPHVQHLSLKNSNILEATLLEILQHCENMKSLDLSGCNMLFMSGPLFASYPERIAAAKKYLKNITALNLSSSRYMNDATLCQLFNLCPLIESINLSSNNILWSSWGLSASNSLTLLIVEQVLSQRASFITEIDFSNTSITSDALTTLSNVKGLCLKSVFLRDCRNVTDKGVINLVGRQSEITTLDLNGSLEIGDDAVREICSKLKELQILKLGKCSKVTSLSINELNLLKKLNELDISECLNITIASLSIGLKGKEKMRALKMRQCNLTKFTDNFFIPYSTEQTRTDRVQGVNCQGSRYSHISMNYVNPPIQLANTLCHIDISSSKYVDDVTLQTINVHLTNLQVLNVSSTNITDRGLLGLKPKRSRFFDEITESSYAARIDEFLSTGKYSSNHGYSGLIEKPGSQFTEEKVQFTQDELIYCMNQRGIIRLTKLRELSLRNCKKISLISLINIFSFMDGSFYDLKKLDLGKLNQAVTEYTLKAITTSPRLTSLSLAYCSMVTDDSLQEMCMHLRSLETINLSSCAGITQSSVITISKVCPWMKEIDITMCIGISPAQAQDLKSVMPLHLKLRTQ